MSTAPTSLPIHRSGAFTLGGKEVHRLGYGAMQITGEGVWGEPADQAECVRTVRRAVELGVDLIDTADSYGPEVSEEHHPGGPASLPRGATSSPPRPG